MSDQPNADALEFFEELKRDDPEYAEYAARMGPLADFMAEYEYQKGIQGITQTELAARAETRQSAISRFEAMKHPPSYDFLIKISKAIGGNLFLSPAAEFCFSIPYDLRDAAEAGAARRGCSVATYATELLREALKKDCVRVT